MSSPKIQCFVVVAFFLLPHSFVVYSYTSMVFPQFSLIILKSALLQSFGKDLSKHWMAVVLVGKLRFSTPHGSYFP